MLADRPHSFWRCGTYVQTATAAAVFLNQHGANVNVEHLDVHPHSLNYFNGNNEYCLLTTAFAREGLTHVEASHPTERWLLGATASHRRASPTWPDASSPAVALKGIAPGAAWAIVRPAAAAAAGNGTMAAAHAAAEGLALSDGGAEDARWLVGAGVLGATYCRRGGGGQFACAVCGLAREVTNGGAAARELRRIAGAALVSRLLKWDLEHQTEGGGGGSQQRRSGCGGAGDGSRPLIT